MTLAALALLAVLALTPLLWSLRRGGAQRGRREAALDLHRAQLVELDRDRDDGRISAVDYATAKLEVQRRLLGAAEQSDPQAVERGGRAVLVAALLVVPTAAAGLYALHGHPELPGAPLAERVAQAEAASKDQDGLLRQLRERLAQLDPTSEQARQGYVLLGNVEDGRGNLAQAAQAWRTALGIRFDPTLAAQVAEAQTQLDGRVTPATAGLFRQALAGAPADAPWRELVEKRLAQP